MVKKNTPQDTMKNRENTRGSNRSKTANTVNTGSSSIVHLPQAQKADESNLSFGAVIQKYRNQNGMSQTELARIMGASRNTVTNWETDKSRPEIDTIRELCTLLGIPLYELFGIPHTGMPSSAENRLLNLYRQLSPVSRKVVDRLVSHMLEEELNARDEVLRDGYFPAVLQNTPAAAGTGCPDTGLPPELVFVKRTRRSEYADTLVRVSGHSMEPKYQDGDMVFVKYSPSADDGEDVVCDYHEGFIIKRMHDRKLYSLNKAYDFGEDHEFDDIRIVGRVVGILEEDDIPAADDIPILEELYAAEIRELNREYGIE